MCSVSSIAVVGEETSRMFGKLSFYSLPTLFSCDAVRVRDYMCIYLPLCVYASAQGYLSKRKADVRRGAVPAIFTHLNTCLENSWAGACRRCTQVLIQPTYTLYPPAYRGESCTWAEVSCSRQNLRWHLKSAKLAVALKVEVYMHTSYNLIPSTHQIGG